MADIKKFLDQAGVGTLWNAVASELNKKANSTDVYTKAEADAAIAAAAYDDTAIKASVKANTDAIAILNGASSVEGSVAFQIAQIVAGADENFDTLKEIADWIAAHPESVTALQSGITANAEAIDALEGLVGDKAVATQIADALAAENLDQYALVADLNALATRVETAEADILAVRAIANANVEAISGHGTRLDAVEIKAANNETAIAQASSRIDGLVAGGGEPNLINSIKVNGVVQNVAADKSVDIAVPVIEALTEAEIKAACGIA